MQNLVSWFETKLTVEQTLCPVMTSAKSKIPPKYKRIKKFNYTSKSTIKISHFLISTSTQSQLSNTHFGTRNVNFTRAVSSWSTSHLTLPKLRRIEYHRTRIALLRTIPCAISTWYISTHAGPDRARIRIRGIHAVAHIYTSSRVWKICHLDNSVRTIHCNFTRISRVSSARCIIFQRASYSVLVDT